MKKKPGKLIEEKRKLMKLSKRELSALSNISHTEVGRIESGERENPNPKILRAIADILDINYLELFFQFGYIGEDLVRCSEIVSNKSKIELEDFTTEELLNELLRREKMK